jgi:antitoxin ParD1/3/4
MALVKKSITVTAGQEQWIRTQVASGEYGNDSEYVRDLIRRDEERNAQCLIVKEAIQQGLASGISEESCATAEGAGGCFSSGLVLGSKRTRAHWKLNTKWI